MQTDIPQSWIEERNNRISQAKAASIGHICNLANGLFGGGGLHPEARETFQIEKLSGTEYYLLRTELQKFLVGSGETDTGFIGQILAAKDTEEFREIVNSYSLRGSRPEKMAAKADDIIKFVKDWLARKAWVDMQFALLPLRAATTGMHAAL